MAYDLDPSTNLRALEFFRVAIGDLLRRPEQRESFAIYAFGILGDGERKSVEPITNCQIGVSPCVSNRKELPEKWLTGARAMNLFALLLSSCKTRPWE